MTTKTNTPNNETCPAETLLRQLSGKWKPQIFRLAIDGPLRFNALLRLLPGASKQSVALALKELEASGLLTKTLVREKPLHIEYHLSEKGQTLVQVFQTLENVQCAMFNFQCTTGNVEFFNLKC